MPSAKEVEHDGIDVGDNQAMLLKKIEELTLYMIEIKKENEAIKKDNSAMKEDNNAIRKEVQVLQKENAQQKAAIQQLQSK